MSSRIRLPDATVPDRLWVLSTRWRRGGRRARLARRSVALLLVAGAGAVALLPEPAVVGSRALAVAADLPVGTTLTARDLTIVPVARAPDGMLSDPGAAVGRTLSGPMRRGEVLTDVRLSTGGLPPPGPGRVVVPVRTADAGAAELLPIGAHLTVLAVDDAGAARVLCSDAVVLAIAPAAADMPSTQGRLVVLAVPSGQADGVAAAAVATRITFRFR